MEAEDKAKKRKPPSRQQKRKISSLREEYLRRQNEWMWLETHLWHAKRMKMVNRYGFRLAEHCSDKGIRAAYKSLVHGCLLSVSKNSNGDVMNIRLYLAVGYFVLPLQ